MKPLSEKIRLSELISAVQSLFFTPHRPLYASLEEATDNLKASTAYQSPKIVAERLQGLMYFDVQVGTTSRNNYLLPQMQ